MRIEFHRCRRHTRQHCSGKLILPCFPPLAPPPLAFHFIAASFSSCSTCIGITHSYTTNRFLAHFADHHRRLFGGPLLLVRDGRLPRWIPADFGDRTNVRGRHVVRRAARRRPRGLFQRDTYAEINPETITVRALAMSNTLASGESNIGYSVRDDVRRAGLGRKTGGEIRERI